MLGNTKGKRGGHNVASPLVWFLAIDAAIGGIAARGCDASYVQQVPGDGVAGGGAEEVTAGDVDAAVARAGGGAEEVTVGDVDAATTGAGRGVDVVWRGWQ